MINLYSNDVEIDFVSTKFPDGTSQVWQLGDTNKYDNYTIEWRWEYDGRELIKVLMLYDLVKSISPKAIIDLHLPYLPYARQDKEVHDKQTFALNTFASILNTRTFNTVKVFDAHSDKAYKIKNLINIKPVGFHRDAILNNKVDVEFYPDSGAYSRYGSGTCKLFGVKIRNQITGAITDYNIMNLENIDLKNKHVMIIDDICDGGATFIPAAKKLKELGAKKVTLCVSHGIFSKGFEHLEDAGIDEFVTTDSLNKNTKKGYYHV